MLEKDLEIYDVWESPNSQLFIRITEDYSIALLVQKDITHLMTMI